MALLKCVRFQRKLYRSGRFLSRFCASIAQKLALIECYQVVHISRLFTENGIEFFEKAKKNPLAGTPCTVRQIMIILMPCNDLIFSSHFQKP